MTRYRTIVADPPWEVDDQRRSHHATGSRSFAYSSMSLQAIKNLAVSSLAAEDAHLFLWSSRKLFREGTAVAVARAWGFEPCGEIVWGLRNPGLGGALGNGHEPVLVARRGRISLDAVLPLGVVFWRQPYAKGKIHSAKPDAFLDLVEHVSPGPYVELFARRARFGWDYWGDQSLGTAELIA